MAVVEPLGSYDSETQIDATRPSLVRLADLLGPVSPELVLVDPELAAQARALLPDVAPAVAPARLLRGDGIEPSSHAEPRPEPSGRAIPWRLGGVVVLVAAAAASFGFGAWIAVAGHDRTTSSQLLSTDEPTFFSTPPPIEPDLSPDAIAELEENARREPRSALAREALGSAYVRLGRWQDAEAEFRALVELSPSDAFARYALGRALAKLGRQSEAARQFELAKSLSDDGTRSADPSSG